MKVDFTFFDYGGNDNFQAPAQKLFRITQDEQPARAVTVDYSKLIPIRIDAKTIVYVKPNRDKVAVLSKYLNRESALSIVKGNDDGPAE